jgi:hypothetical protein
MRNGKDTILDYFKVLFQHSFGGIEANHEKVRIVSDVAKIPTGHFPRIAAL